MKNIKEKLSSIINKLKEKTTEIFKNKKKAAILGGIILGVIIIVVVLVLVLGGKFGNKSQEDQLKANLEELGREFYENLYYPNTKNGDDEARAQFLDGFKDQGLKFDIDNLSRYEYSSEEVQKKLDSFVNEKTGEECDKKESKLVVYPKDPYGVKDYEVEVILVCGFDEE